MGPEVQVMEDLDLEAVVVAEAVAEATAGVAVIPQGEAEASSRPAARREGIQPAGRREGAAPAEPAASAVRPAGHRALSGRRGGRAHRRIPRRGGQLRGGPVAGGAAGPGPAGRG